jgi:hypothetical protein
MHRQTQHAPVDNLVVVDVRGPGEWIVGVPGGRSLHVYRLAPADWLVSEVGRGNEGRGADLEQALDALCVGAPRAAWWDSVAEFLHGGEGRRT